MSTSGKWAPLTNLTLCARALERAINRSPNLPGVVAFTGPSGWGKSMAASYCANKFDGVYVECRSYFTRKSFVAAILREMGIKAARTIPDMMEQAAEQLTLSRRPLIIDELDYLVDRPALDMVRDLFEMARGTFMLIGEEQFPAKLKRSSERLHNRVLVWQRAQPASREDAHKLAAFYCPAVAISDDLIEFIRQKSENNARVISVSLDLIRQHCQARGLRRIDLDSWAETAAARGTVGDVADRERRVA